MCAKLRRLAIIMFLLVGAAPSALLGWLVYC